MTSKQAKVTDFFQHRRKTQSPLAKRSKFCVTGTDGEEYCPLPPNTPDITLSTRPELSAKKRKIVHKSPVGDTILISAPPSSKAVRQLRFTKARRRLSNEKNDDKNETVASLQFHTLNASPSTKVLTSPLKSFSSPLTKLSVENVKKNFGKVRNLHELRQRLATFSETAARLNDLVDAHKIEISKLPESSTTPKKATEEANPKEIEPSEDAPYVPAYQRYAHLVSNHLNTNLELPVGRKVLLDTFRAADQLVSIMYNRMELITFDKLKAGVQKMTRKNFERQHLGQFKTVYPEAYCFEQMKISGKFGYNCRSDEYSLTIAPNLDSDLKSYQINTPAKTPSKRREDFADRTPPSSPVKSSLVTRTPSKTPSGFVSPFKNPLLFRSPHKTPNKPEAVDDKGGGADRLKPLSGARLVCRSEIFKKNLLVLLNEEHNKFLASLTPSIVLTTDEQSNLQRWHPKFALNSLPDIVPSELPQPPLVEKIHTAKEVLEKQKNKPLLPFEVETALKKVSVESPTSTSNVDSPSSSKKFSTKGIPTDLLTKIRAKESLKNLRDFARSPVDDLKRLRLSRLPEMVKIIKMFFATENKMVLPQELVTKKLIDSYKSLLSNAEIDNHMKLLLENAPDWLTQTNVREKGVYLRVNKTFVVNNLIDKLTKMTE